MKNKIFLIAAGIGLAAFIFRKKVRIMFKNIDDFKNKIPEIFGREYYFFPYKTKNTGKLNSDLAAFLKEKEGGISADPSDSAAAYPAPFLWIDPKDGRSKRPHTAYGVTWKTFEKYASVFGYSATKENFINMPESIRVAIFKRIYAAPYAAATPSQLINLYLGLWAWGSGSAKPTLSTFSRMFGMDLKSYYKKYGESKTLLAAVLARIQRFKDIAASDPDNEKFLKGWINGAINFYYIFSPYAR